MPPRRATGRTASGQQSRLSFGTQSRITKPSTTASHKGIKNVEPIVREATKSASLTSPSASSAPDTALPEQIPVTPSEQSSRPHPHKAELAIREQAKQEHSQPYTEEDKKALAINEAQIKKYWNDEERNRKAPRGSLTLSHPQKFFFVSMMETHSFG